MKSFPTIDLKATGKNIRKLRINCGYTVRQLQEYFGFEQPQAIYKWQWGESLPSVDNLLALSMLFNIPINSILIVKGNQGIAFCIKILKWIGLKKSIHFILSIFRF